MNKLKSTALTLFFLASLAVRVGANAGDLPITPMSMQLAGKLAADSASISKYKVPALDLQALRAGLSVKPAQPQPLEFARPYNHPSSVLAAGTWQETRFQGQDILIWRYQIDSPNAYSLNLGFSRYLMPQGGRLFLYADGYQQLRGPFTDQDNETHGQLWTPMVHGKSLIIEINILKHQRAELEIELGKINQAFLDIRNLRAEINTLKSGSCNVDVVCPASAGWEDQIRSVAVYSLGGSVFCTGAVINNIKDNTTPYFLTANHCGIGAGNAPSVVAFWNYQNSTCRAVNGGPSGGAGDGNFSQFNTGAILRASYVLSDMTLLEFDDPLLPAANVYMAGWSRADQAPPSAVAIHHPNAEEKRISFENDALSIQGYLSNNNTGTSHLRVADWDLGTTEPGSSGSPLFDANKRIVGQLHGGFAACVNDDPDWYGRLAISWDGGGSPGTRLKDWLDPENLAPVVLDGADVGAPLSIPVADDYLLELIPIIIDARRNNP